MKKFKVLSLFLPLLTAGILLTLVWGMVGVQRTLASPVEQPVSLPGPHLIDDFQGGVPSTWFTYGDGGAGAYYAPSAVLTNTLTAQGVVSNTVLRVDYNIAGWGAGGGRDLAPDDWSNYDGLSLWFFGTNSGTQYRMVLSDNKTDPGNDTAERFATVFTDDFSGWQEIKLPWEVFFRDGWQPGGAPDDGLTLTEVWGYAFGFPAGVGARTNFIELFTTYGNVTPPAVEPKIAFADLAYNVVEGEAVTITVQLNTPLTYTVSVDYATVDDTTTALRDYLPMSGTLTFTAGATQQAFVVQTLDDIKYEGNELLELQLLNPVGIVLGSADAVNLTIADNDLFNPNLLDDFERAPYAFETWGGIKLSLTEIMLGDTMALPGQGMYENVLTVDAASRAFTPTGTSFSRTFYAAQDWSSSDGVEFWYYGQNSGETITVTLQGNAQPDPGPSGWTMVWNDEFDVAAGAAVNDARWTHETGGWGWGNAEWEYYTDSTENSATDGSGNLAITARLNEDTSLKCDHSPNEDDTCFATSARLITAEKFEFAYGRVESRLKVPYGQGIWPAFWMLGNDIGSVGWPTSGEIDIMENVGYEPNIVHGTIHGPGYSGGSGIGGAYTLESGNFADDFHVFAIEWEPTEIRWYVDGEQYFSVTPENLPDGADWVFDHPFYLLLNVAVGGNWPGYPDGSTTFPQTMTVDYVRVYQAPDTAERHEATFTDNFSGWKKVRVPFTAFERSAEQPQGAPDDGFDPAEIWGYGFELPASLNLPIHLDQVALYSQVEYKIYLPLVRK